MIRAFMLLLAVLALTSLSGCLTLGPPDDPADFYPFEHRRSWAMPVTVTFGEMPS